MAKANDARRRNENPVLLIGNPLKCGCCYAASGSSVHHDPRESTMTATSASPIAKRSAALALLLVTPIPILGTTVTMVCFPDSLAAKVLFGLAKAVIFITPIVWAIKVDKQKLRIPRWSNKGMTAACVTGALIFIIIAAAYYGFGKDWIDLTTMRAKIEQMKLNNLWVYLAGALYW